jgi:RNA 2',3'-cyclic 3'-phosphodiesterase
MARAFVAVRLPEYVLDAVESVAPALDAGARYTTREQKHLTLQFLGNRADVDAVAAALDAIAVARGEVQLGGGGAFPKARRARVLWVGVLDGGAFLTQLAAAVGALLAPLGHEPEDRTYHPHVTLARWKTPTDARPAIASIGDGAIGTPFAVDEIVLYQSQLRRDGAQYTARAVVPLA